MVKIEAVVKEFLKELKEGKSRQEAISLIANKHNTGRELVEGTIIIEELLNGKQYIR
jgi:hypothetical protein